MRRGRIDVAAVLAVVTAMRSEAKAVTPRVECGGRCGRIFKPCLVCGSCVRCAGRSRWDAAYCETACRMRAYRARRRSV